jgi:hypothetical protein|tara:strand:+ start:311 stop:658 length:348 start_codon:yes stop_codon:yes gene_type:complete
MKLLNKNICLTDRRTIMLIIGVIITSTVLASVFSGGEIKEIVTPTKKEEMWVPTEVDIAFQDSMYNIIQNTQDDITDIKKDIVLIIERLDYEDGTWDSIRYVKGSEIDLRRNKQN